MMNAKAHASIAFKAEKYGEALKIINEALETIREFFTSIDQPEAFGQSSEVRMLRRFARDIRRKMPVDPIERLKHQLERAVKAERYEEAAKLRDQIKRETNTQGA
jgi:excinuclease UvrABC helicase subunit UvrB